MFHYITLHTILRRTRVNGTTEKSLKRHANAVIHPSVEGPPLGRARTFLTHSRSGQRNQNAKCCVDQSWGFLSCRWRDLIILDRIGKRYVSYHIITLTTCTSTLPCDSEPFASAHRPFSPSHPM